MQVLEDERRDVQCHGHALSVQQVECRQGRVIISMAVRRKVEQRVDGGRIADEAVGVQKPFLVRTDFGKVVLQST